ncbi:Cytochrome P450 [Rhypophila sp. PSN 637]
MTLISLLVETQTASGYLLLGVGICLVSLVYLAATLIYNIFLHPLASFPGPIHYRASPLPHLVQEWSGNTVHKWVELHQKYGDVVRISPNQLSYISVNAWRDIYGARGSSTNSLKGASSETMLKEELEFPGDDFEFFAPEKPMISCDATNHARHRRAVGPAFSDRAVRSYEPVLIRYTDDMLNRLQQDQEGTTIGVNIMDWFHFVMFDITSALVFGKCFGNMAKKEYHPWVARIFPGMKLIAWSLVIAAIPGLGRLVSWFIPKKMVDEARRHMQSIVDMTDSRAADPPAQSDFMTYIHPQVNQPFKPSSSSTLSTPELYLNSQLLCIAGSETTASLLAGAVYFLSQSENKPHLDRLLAELQSNFDSEEEITPSRLNPNATPFLCAILSECLRLYPPGAINMPRTVAPGGALIDGKYVPGGTVVGIAQYAAYRSPRNWVEPLRFAPERWLSLESSHSVDTCQGLEREIKRYHDDRKEVFKPFSYGPRNCVGQNLALAECRLITTRLFWRFEVDMLPGHQGWIDGQRTFLSWEKPELMVKLSPREH